jgi:predicted  nucleic acid-binding Zn-ribbon protein
MTDTPKSADKQPDQADPQTATETPGKTDTDQRRVLVCLNCGHLWEAKAGTLRPQCFECKRQRVRPATAEEIEWYDKGIRNLNAMPGNHIPADTGKKPAEPDQKKAEKKPDKQPDQADQSIDQQIDPRKLVDPVRIIPKKKSVAAPEPSPMFPAVLLLVILGIIAALYFLFARSQHQEIPQEYPIEEPEPAPFRFAGASLPGM